MTLLATLPQSRPAVDLSKTLVSYVPPVSYNEDVAPVEILEAKKIIGSGPNTGLRTWEAALRLAYHLHSRPELVKGRRVLELGAGTGFLSIFCAAYLQPAAVTTSDGHEEVLTSLRDNVQRNSHLFGPSGNPIVQKLYWGDEGDIDRVIHDRSTYSESKTAEDNSTGGRSSNTPYDVIIGADISYDPNACKALAKTLSLLAKANPYTDILISATQRNIQTLSGFLDECQSVSCGLRVELVNFEAPPFTKQTGLFHNVASPIQIFTMWYAPPQIS
jgi:protein-lysine N-methyltransferase EEF2KMT